MFNRIKYLLTISLISSIGACCAQNSVNPLPFILQDENQLASFKKLYQTGDAEAAKEVQILLTRADAALQSAPYSVTFHKTKLPKGANLHDYISQAPYWWPDPSKPDGKPYIRKDGRQNPERDSLKDDSQMTRLSSDVKKLGMAYYFTRKEQYAKKAVDLLKVWFIEKSTRMNPNLNYAQFIPGICDGRGIGIIETVRLTAIPDALALMQGSKSMNTVFVSAIKQWFRQYEHWMVNSKNGKDERSQINNHGTNYDMQLADFSLFTGDKTLTRKVIKEQTFPRIDQQFTVDGAQPLELIRTKSWGYSTMNLSAWCKLAIISKRVNIDLWHQETMDGKGIRRAIEWFTPYILKEKEWHYEQIVPFNNDNILDIYHIASDKYPNLDSKKVFKLYPEYQFMRFD